MSRTLYPKISEYKQEWLAVSDVHQLYIEQAGNPNGIAVIYLHGGPGGGSSANYRRYFDPHKYRIILFDQRGCGKSIPSASIKQNTTQDLVTDIEKVRQHLNIKQWLITGGSWGTTLALCYAIAFPSQVLGFVLRGVFLGGTREINWLYNEGGVERFFPEYYQEFTSVIDDKSAPLLAYQKIFTSNNELAIIAASKAWFLWELRLSTLEHHHIGMAQIEDSHQALCMAQVSNHYFTHHCFLAENYIVNNIEKFKHLPAIILHGRYDMVCQAIIAQDLSKKWLNAQLQILPQAGHSGFETQTIDAFCKATDIMANFLEEQAL